MSFAFGVLQLEEAMKEEGCPICRLGQRAAFRSMDTLFWEGVNDPGIRKRIMASYGFCPNHTALLFDPELLKSAPVLGINIIYEQLVRVMGKELHALQYCREKTNRLQQWLRRLRPAGKVIGPASVLRTATICPVCEIVDQVSRNALATLLMEIENQSDGIWDTYRASNGLCFIHLRLALEQYREKYPQATQAVLEDTITRLERQQRLMSEFVRKSNWEYRVEELTEEEGLVWKTVLAFFMGLQR